MEERVLVVDDEPDVCRLVTYSLEKAGFRTEAAATGAEALLAVGRSRPAVVVLDVGLPDLSGIEVCKRLRADRNLASVGVLMLTALGADHDRIAGLEAGADDYVVKPFNVDELVLRVQALTRRLGERNQAPAEGGDELLSSGALTVNPLTHDVRAGDEPLELRPLEFKLLVTIMSEPGRVFTRAELLKRVWDIDEGGNPRTVDVHIRRLRQNLRACAEQIETVPGFGYRAKRS
ncbi:MAG: response regulator transcription factor [Deltaproteobacteria bacterium]|nr:response regulator transcription factor [Deltaproteobacteria bacterium]